MAPVGSGAFGSGAFVVEWNLRCAQTFPDDAIKIGDVIVIANSARSPDIILEVLSEPGEPRLLILARWKGSSAADAMAPGVAAPGIGAPPGGAVAEILVHGLLEAPDGSREAAGRGSAAPEETGTTGTRGA